MGELADFKVGDTVELQDGRIGTVQFAGETLFSAGEWLGLKLNDGTGKNDGAVQGQRYFECPPGYGMFVRPAAAEVIDRPFSQANTKPSGTANGVTLKPPPSSTATRGLSRQSLMDPMVQKRQSINTDSPTPSVRTTMASKVLRSPSKSPTKHALSITASGNTTPKPGVLAPVSKSSIAGNRPRNSAAARSTLGPSPTSLTSRASRPSVAATSNGLTNSHTRPNLPGPRGPGSSNRPSILQNGLKKPNHLNGGAQINGQGSQSSLPDHHEPELLSLEATEPQDDHTSQLSSLEHRPPPMSRVTTSSTSVPVHGKLSPIMSQKPSQPGLATIKEVDELKAKLRIMEKKRLEDRENLKTMETVQAERDKFEAIIQKLQAKYQPQQQEIGELKRQIKEADAKAQMNENAQGENDIALEMATLDREMAEETAESLKTELDALRQAHEELELETEILREENAELGREMSPEERATQGWMQLERSNHRLREALMRLRDVSKEQEAGLKQQVRELEKDVEELGNIRALYETTKENLARSDTALEDLHQQLETALGAEDMIEELVEKNMSLTERIEDLRVTVEDLESLKELNDELEINHMETEKQLQDEVNYQETIIHEQTKKTAVQNETINDLEQTLSRFRVLVSNLQNDLEDMRASQQISEAEASQLTNQSKAMLDLNMRLQSSASKAQIKAIDIELRRLEAQESAEHLAIVQRFLPSSFERERNSIYALLRIKRIGFKANLMHSLIKENLNGQTLPGHEDAVFASYDIMDKLTWLLTMCERLIGCIQTYDLTAFSKLEASLYDLEPVERALNGWIHSMKKDELKEELCAAELHRSIALMTHLSETHIGNGLEQYAEDVRTRALLMQSSLDNAAAAISYIKSMVQSKLPIVNDTKEEDDEELQDFFRKIDSIISQTRIAKVISSKAVRQLEELKSRSLTLDPSTLLVVEQSQASTSEFAAAIRNAGVSLSSIINQEGRTSSFTCAEITQAVSNSDSSAFSSLNSKIQITGAQMQNFYNITNTLSQTIEFPDTSTFPPPWDLLAQRLRDETRTSATHELEVERLKGELQEKNTGLALKDKLVEELGVNVEVLERRVGESGGRRERLRELENAFENAKSKERELTKRFDRLQQELHDTENERETLRKQVSQNGPSFGPHGSPKVTMGQHEITPIRAQQEIRRLKAEMSSLQSTIRYLRISTQQASFSASHSFLSAPLIPKSIFSEKAHIGHEARDVLKSMLKLVTETENSIVQLQPRVKENRLKWRPVRESTKWQVGKQREEWEAWREWSYDVGRRGRELVREEERKKKASGGHGDVLAQVSFHLPAREKGSGEAVRIVRPEDWEEVERELGVA